MKFITTFIFLIIFSFSLSAQTTVQPLATASGRSFTAQDLSPKVAAAWLNLKKNLANARSQLLEKQIERTLLDTEATSRKISVQKLLETEVSNKVTNPTESEIKTIYKENKASLGNTPLKKVRKQIVEYLQNKVKKESYTNYIKGLQQKYKIATIKNVNDKRIVSKDILATVGKINITYDNFIKKNGIELYEYEANIFDAMKNSLVQVVDSAIYASEAQSLGITTSEYIAREITNKLKTYSDEETERIQTNLRKRLYPKYRVRYFIDEPEPFIQSVSADNDPFLGKATAPVTVVMFTDFQCPTCASVYPVLKNVVAKYGNDVRLVIRDFPLEQIHENAFQAAVAANAAHKQGKFFEFKEILYKNQNSLDTESLKKYAAEIGLNVKKFEKDLNNQAFVAEVRKDIVDGRKYGVNGTPSIYVNGYRIRHLSATSFKKAIERALKK